MRPLSHIIYGAFLCLTLVNYAHDQYLDMLIYTHCPQQLQKDCLTFVHHSKLPTSSKDYAAIIETLNHIMSEYAERLDASTYDHLKRIVAHAHQHKREPREPRPDSQEPSDDMSSDSSDEFDDTINKAVAGSIGVNSNKSFGFNFATDQSQSTQTNQSFSYNFTTYQSSINTNASHDINFATDMGHISSSGKCSNFNVDIGGNISCSIRTSNISFLSGDKNTVIATQGSESHPARLFNVVIGSGSQLYATNPIQQHESINLVTSGALADGPPNGINFYAGNNNINCFGNLDLHGYDIFNMNSVNSGFVSSESLTSDRGITINYDTNGTGDASFQVQENNTVLMQVDNAAIRQYQDLDMSGHDISRVSQLSGNNGPITVSSTIDMQGHDIKNTDIRTNSMASETSVFITYDTDDSNTDTTTPSDDAFLVREGSSGTTAFRIGKHAAVLQGRPFNLQGNTLEEVSDITGKHNHNIHLMNNANIIIEPGTGNDSGHLEFRNIGMGSGSPLVIENGVVKEESSTKAHKLDIRSCFEDALTELLRLRPVSFVRSLEQEFREHGFIAEEVAQILPEVIVYDTQGSPYAIKYTQLIALLVQAIQQQEASLALQQESITNLQQRVQRIENSQ